ncbi:hypothetical protein HYE30_02365 [Mycoplasmopsis bovis]|nr:hypothetical protein [Mycoplasmopsis bovis]QQH22552.1 hypothetical protein HYE30_02365 [Mycoplasmopsis bovis]
MSFSRLEEYINLDEVKRRFGKLAKGIKLDRAVNWLLRNPEMKLKVIEVI